MSTNHENNTATWCEEHTAERARCGCVFYTDPFRYAVDAEVARLRIADVARREYAAERTPPAPPFDLDTLGRILARPYTQQWRVDGIIPADAGTLFSAQRKTGKTTGNLNLARSLLTGSPFLGTFDVIPLDGNIGYLNYEVSAHTFAAWADDAGIPHDRLVVASLRGRRNPFADADDAARLAEMLRDHDVETLMVDPFGRAYSGASQNDAGEVGAWLAMLDRFTRSDVGARDLILAAHAGWNGERTRGSSALEDWADSIITLTRGVDDDARYLRAMGRDVDIEEDRLHFDRTTRTLTLTGTGSRTEHGAERSVDAMCPAVLAFVAANPGCSGRQITSKVKGNDGVIVKARRSLVESGQVIEDRGTGRGGGYSYRTPEPLPTAAEPLLTAVGTAATAAIEQQFLTRQLGTEVLPDPDPGYCPPPCGMTYKGSACPKGNRCPNRPKEGMTQ